MSLEVNALDPLWMEFIRSVPDAMIFHHPAWMRLIAESYGYKPFVVGERDADGRYRAGVPIMEVDSPFTGKRWVSLPFSDFCAPLGESANQRHQLAEQILTQAEAAGIRRVELRGMYPHHPSLIADSEFVAHELDLEEDHEKVLSRVHEMHRRNIKIARQKGVEIVRGKTNEHLREYFHLHLLTRRRQGTPSQPWKFLGGLQKLFDQELGFVLLAYVDRKCVAGAVYLHFQKTLTYKYGASLIDNLQVRPNNLVMWTAIQWACENGFSKLDLGRSDPSNEGLRTFKSRWGAREFHLPYAYLAPHAKKTRDGKLTSFLGNVIQKSPPWVCQLTGELLYKHFG